MKARIRNYIAMPIFVMVWFWKCLLHILLNFFIFFQSMLYQRDKRSGYKRWCWLILKIHWLWNTPLYKMTKFNSAGNIAISISTFSGMKPYDALHKDIHTLQVLFKFVEFVSVNLLEILSNFLCWNCNIFLSMLFGFDVMVCPVAFLCVQWSLM